MLLLRIEFCMKCNLLKMNALKHRLLPGEFFYVYPPGGSARLMLTFIAQNKKKMFL